MTFTEATERFNRRRIRQPPSIPFLWEERPGIAKKDWKPGVSSVTPPLPPPSPIPIKFIASVPFNWEQKPGTPLLSFAQPLGEPAAVAPAVMLMTLPPPPVYSPAYCNGWNSNDGGDGSDKQEETFEMDLEAFGFETDDSFSSAPSLLANCLVPSTVVSTAVPVQKTYLTDNSSDHVETPSSPASETDSTSSYATGTSSLVGASFLECLFPLLPPNSAFLEKARYPDHHGSQAQSEFDRESNNTVTTRRPPTLGELIMMSRRMSYQRKAVQMREQHLSMEFPKERALGCCIFGTGAKLIEGLQWRKLQPRLNFL